MFGFAFWWFRVSLEGLGACGGACAVGGGFRRLRVAVCFSGAFGEGYFSFFLYFYGDTLALFRSVSTLASGFSDNMYSSVCLS